MIRVSDLEGSEDDTYAGDRLLSVWIADQKNLAFFSSSVKDNFGTNESEKRIVETDGDLFDWHYVYFGYSRE